MKYLVLTTIFSVCSLLACNTLQSQKYPDPDHNMPQDLVEETNELMEEAQKSSDKAWQKALPTVMEQARNGRPYIPFVSMPAHLKKASIPAFPGAEGGGAYTPGGRGGDVYVVTSLDDSGPGTLREACRQGGARTIVFNVSGIIELETPIQIRAPYVTIAGQTAPGDGICVAGETFTINTHDVIVRHMRFRRGITKATRPDDAMGADGPGVGNIIIDHCSVSWGLDENFSIYRNMWHSGYERKKLPAVNITVQNTISSEALDTYNHAFGSTLGGRNSTFMRNLWANNTGRNPSVGMDGDFTYVNNVLFNWYHRTVDGGGYNSMFNMINNYYKPGPVTPENDEVRHRILEPERGNVDSAAYGRAYVKGNIVEGNEKVTKDNWAGGVQLGGMSHEEAKEYFDYIRVHEPFPFLDNVTIMSAKNAYEFVLDNVGATLPKRDPVDKRIVKQVRTGEINNTEGEPIEVGDDRRLPPDSYKDGIIVDIKQVGGYPEYNGEPYPDSDKDGMPDAWEEKYGLDPNDPSDATGDLNGDGYTNIEMYINGIDPTKTIDWTKEVNNFNTLADQDGLLKR